ncbi:MAG: sigma-54-dependent Fis family transcriptional regulator [candidate division NC10 bacterium]|nr:sigma-54-dependent Fis family transcriptional regulator [candidate division NC10 bacterium]
MDPLRIFVVDDEAAQRELIGGFLRKQGHEVLLAGSGGEAAARVREMRVDLVLSDFKMPGMSGLELLRAVKAVSPEIPFILVTAYGTVETAVQAMKEGAADYLTKPLDLEELLLRIGRVSEQVRLQSAVRQLQAHLVERHRLEGIIGESGRMQEVLALVKRVAPSEATVLIRGESGTGKELIARAIHFNSPRATGPLVTLNCAALPEHLLESELFGHEKGAFTGAVAQRKGRFELADGGSIFLDEIGDLSPALQVKLLRVLQERQFERLGGNRTLAVSVRILAATHRDLEQAMRDGTFREDLYYRLNVVTIQIPPLRERREDIPPLLDHFLRKFAEKNRRAVTGLTAAARDALLRYDYPGNVRELENLVERAVLLTRGQVIDLPDLPVTLRPGERGPAESGTLGVPPRLPDLLAGIEREAIRAALERHGGVQTQAAAELGISERVLRYKMRKHGLEGRPD